MSKFPTSLMLREPMQSNYIIEFTKIIPISSYNSSSKKPYNKILNINEIKQNTQSVAAGRAPLKEIHLPGKQRLEVSLDRKGILSERTLNTRTSSKKTKLSIISKHGIRRINSFSLRSENHQNIIAHPHRSNQVSGKK